MTAHLAHAGLAEVIGWAVVITALLALVARAVADGSAYLGGRLYRPVRRAGRVLLAYGRTRAAAMRRPHRHRRPHPRLAALWLAARFYLTRFTIPGGNR